MKYKIISQKSYDERLFVLEDEDGAKFNIDFFTGGELKNPEYTKDNPELFENWLKSLVGKTIEIEKLIANDYFTNGEVKLIK